MSHGGGTWISHVCRREDHPAAAEQERCWDGEIHPSEDSQAAGDAQPPKSLFSQDPPSKQCCKSQKAGKSSHPPPHPLQLREGRLPSQPRSAGLAQHQGEMLFPPQKTEILFSPLSLSHSWVSSGSHCSAGVK